MKAVSVLFTPFLKKKKILISNHSHIAYNITITGRCENVFPHLTFGPFKLLLSSYDIIIL